MNRRSFQKFLAVLLLPVLLLTGCWKDSSDSDDWQLPMVSQSSEKTEGTQSQSLPAEFSLPYLPDLTLDPVTCQDGTQQTVSALLFEGLYELNEQLEPRPVLCSISNYDAASLTWTFTLRGDVTFSDGSPLTGADVAQTLLRARTSDRYRARLSGVKSIRADGVFVSIALNVADTGFPALLDIPIVKSGTQDDLVPIGTGPYLFEADDTGKYLAANPDWWGGAAQPVSRIDLVACDGEDAVRYQFTSRTVQLITCDLIGTNPLSATGSFEFTDADTTVLQYVGFNLKKPLLADSAVRRALGLGVDRNTVASAYLSSHARAAQFPVSPVSALYPSELENEYSFSSYSSALSAAGLGEKAIELTMIVNSENTFKTATAKYIASTLCVSGLQVTVKALPFSDYLAALSSGDYDLYYGEAKLPANWDLRALLSAGGALNYGGYSNATMNLLINQYAAASDRSGAMLTLCRYFQKEAPVIPICFRRTSVLCQAGVVKNLTPTAGNPFFDLNSCEICLAK